VGVFLELDLYQEDGKSIESIGLEKLILYDSDAKRVIFSKP